jgi:hypothetical protein
MIHALLKAQRNMTPQARPAHPEPLPPPGTWVQTPIGTGEVVAIRPPETVDLGGGYSFQKGRLAVSVWIPGHPAPHDFDPRDVRPTTRPESTGGACLPAPSAFRKTGVLPKKGTPRKILDILPETFSLRDLEAAILQLAAARAIKPPRSARRSAAAWARRLTKAGHARPAGREGGGSPAGAR